MFGKRAKLLELQNIILNEPLGRLIMNEKQVMQAVDIMVDNNNRISADCSKILQTTIKPDIFFGRLELLEAKTAELALLEKHIKFNNPKPSQVLETLREEKQKIIDQFLTRYFNSVVDKIASLKTDSAKNKHCQKCYDSLQPYYTVMNESNILYVERFYRQQQAEILS